MKLYHAHIMIACCLLPSLVSGNSRRDYFEKLRDGNCTSCRERLKINVGEVLPRLSLIKQRILSALGKKGEDKASENTGEIEQTFSLMKKMPDSAARPRTYGLNEIVSVSHKTSQRKNDTVIRFQVRKQFLDYNSEAVGASLLLFLDRKRRMKKGGRGKKVFIEISSKSNSGKESDAWKVLAFFRTRVKKRRWKSISLPLGLAQTLLKPNIHHVDLKVKCIGCGRLVDLVLDTERGKTRKRKVAKKIKVKRQSSKKRQHLIRQKPRRRANPILIISTRYKIS